MSFARTLEKLKLYQTTDPKLSPYENDGLPQVVTNIGNTLDYIVSSMFPNAKPAVATEALLPAAGNDLNDYRIVDDYNSTGTPAGYRWTQLEGQPTPQWNLDQLFNSNDSILQQWALDAAALFVSENGQPGGQTVHGSTLPNEDLTLSANSGDGTLDPTLQTGHIVLFGDTKPSADDVFELGTNLERFASIYLAGELRDGTDTATVAQMAIAYAHSQVTSGNPHSVTYIEVLSRLGNLTVSGDVTTEVIDLSTGGDKALTITITDDSHNHTVSTITDFNDATWALLKARLVDTSNITWSFNDPSKEASATVTVTTDDITDIAAPTVNKILSANPAGDAWRTTDGAVNITGDVTGSGTYDSTTDSTELRVDIVNTPLDTVDRINLQNLSFTSAIGNPTTITLSNHSMLTGRKIRILGAPPLNGEHIITVVDGNTFTVPVNTTGIETGYAIPNASQLLYDSLTDTYEVKLENAQLSHYEISDLLSDDHTQYIHKNGRTDGSNNVVTGGELDNGNLILQSNSATSRGSILLRDNLNPEVGAVYLTGNWEGTDIGSSSRPIRDIHLRGELKGGRVEQLLSLPTASAQERGRIVQIPNGELYWNKDGISYKKLWEFPNLVGQSGKALVVSADELSLDFTEVDVIATDSLAGEITSIGNTTASTITAPANAIGIYIQADEANPSSLRMAWGSSNPAAGVGVELLHGEREFFRISSNFKVIAESGTIGKLSYTWSIK
jgi:hypothetical protein